MGKIVKSNLEQSRLTQAIGIVFNYDERWLEFFYSHKGGGLRCSPDILIAESGCFSRGEQIMIKVALDLWTDGKRVSLSEILNSLDWDNLNRVLFAVMILRDVTPDDLSEIRTQYES